MELIRECLKKNTTHTTSLSTVCIETLLPSKHTPSFGRWYNVVCLLGTNPIFSEYDSLVPFTVHVISTFKKDIQTFGVRDKRLLSNSSQTTQRMQRHFNARTASWTTLLTLFKRQNNVVCVPGKMLMPRQKESWKILARNLFSKSFFYYCLFFTNVHTRIQNLRGGSWIGHQGRDVCSSHEQWRGCLLPRPIAEGGEKTEPASCDSSHQDWNSNQNNGGQ